MLSRTVKSIVRRTIPDTHYRYLEWHKSVFGSLPAILSYLRFMTSRDGVSRVSVPRSSHGAYLRAGTTDQDVFGQVFVNREYELDLGDPTFIVDAGAHRARGDILCASLPASNGDIDRA